MKTFILERSSVGVFGYTIFNSDITTQTFFIETKRGTIESDKNRRKLYNKFQRLNGIYESRNGVRRVGDELNNDY